MKNSKSNDVEVTKKQQTRAVVFLLRLLDKRGWTHARLAEEIGRPKSQGYVSRILSGDAEPGRSTIDAFRAVGCKAAWWFEVAEGEAA